MLRALHRWCGVAASILLTIQGVTGVLWSNQDALTALFQPQAVAAADGARAPLDTFLAAIHARAVGARLDRLALPTDEGRLAVARVVTPGGRVEILLIDPATAGVRSAGPIWAFPAQLAERVHGSLLLGPVGHWVLFAEGLILIAMATTGLIVWWPGLARLRPALTLQVKAPPRRLLRDLHLVPGALAASLLLVTGFTGTLMAVEPLTAALVSRVAPISRDIEPVLPAAPPGAKAMTAQQALAALESHFPSSRLIKIRTMGPRDRMILGVFVDSRTRNPRAYDMAGVDRMTGALTVFVEATRNAPGDAAIAWLAPIHAGEIYGPFRAVIATAGGLTLVLMVLTGLANWLLRIRSRGGRATS